MIHLTLVSWIVMSLLAAVILIAGVISMGQVLGRIIWWEMVRIGLVKGIIGTFTVMIVFFILLTLRLQTFT